MFINKSCNNVGKPDPVDNLNCTFNNQWNIDCTWNGPSINITGILLKYEVNVIYYNGNVTECTNDTTYHHNASGLGEYVNIFVAPVVGDGLKGEFIEFTVNISIQGQLIDSYRNSPKLSDIYELTLAS